MLEAIRQRAEGWLVKLILALLLVPFALWGVDSYFHGGSGGDTIAKVGDQKISGQEFTQALRDQQERLRQALGGAYNPAIMDSPEARAAVLQNLINQHLLAMAAARQHLLVPDQELASLIAQVPAFQDDGKFSKERYEALLRSQNLTPKQFETQVRQQLLAQQLLGALSESVIMPASVADGVIRFNEEQRSVSTATIASSQFLSQVKIDPAAIKAYYDGHSSEFAVPEEVQVQYVTLSPQVLGSQVPVSDQEVQQYYQQHQSQFGVPEQRDAAHILIGLPQNPTPEQVKAAQAKAEAVYQEAVKSPGDFAALAKKYSQDPGSADKGGDLGFFTREDMVKPFSDAAFSMQVGEIKGPVQSQFGFHIIKLLAIKPGKIKPLAEVKDQIVAELRKEQGSKKFAQVADSFGNTVYEQSGSLKPAADDYKLPIQTSGWISKAGGPPPFNNPKLLQAIFSPDAMKQGHNTDAIEVAPSTLVSARVVAQKPAGMKSLEEVKDQIARKLQQEQANALAKKQGETLLAALQGGKAAEVKWDAPALVTRQQGHGMDPVALAQAFKLDASKVPAYGGIADPQGGYLLIKVDKVVPAGAIDDAKRKAYLAGLKQLMGNELTSSFLGALRRDTKVEIKEDKLKAAQL